MFMFDFMFVRNVELRRRVTHQNNYSQSLEPCSRHASDMHWACTWTVSGMRWACFQHMPGMFVVCVGYVSKHVLGMLLACIGAVLDMFWASLGTGIGYKLQGSRSKHVQSAVNQSSAEEVRQPAIL